MKPVKLVIEGVNSFSERVEIDFAPLLKNGLFGIFGDTGSGKSSILDSVVLALYGETHRSTKNEQFVNVRCQRAYVSFAFETDYQGERRTYEVWREFSFSKDRKTLSHKAQLSEIKGGVKYPMTDKSKETDAAIREIVGLDRKDFETCIALPQGEFASFVKATRGDRLETCGRLFSLSKYSKYIYDRTNAELQKHKDECNRLEGALQQLAEYTDEGKEELKQQLLGGEQRLSDLKIRAEQFEKDCRKAQEKFAAQTRVAEAETEYVQAVRCHEAAQKRWAEAQVAQKAAEAISAQEKLGETRRKQKENEEVLRRTKAAQEQAKKEEATAENAIADCRRAAPELIEKRSKVLAAEQTAELYRQKQAAIEAERAEYKNKKEETLTLQAQKEKAEKRLAALRAEADGMAAARQALIEASAWQTKARFAEQIRRSRAKIAPLVDCSPYAVASEKEWDALQAMTVGGQEKDDLQIAAGLEKAERAAKEAETLAADVARLQEKIAQIEAQMQAISERGIRQAEELKTLCGSLSVLEGKSYADALRIADSAVRENKRKTDEALAEQMKSREAADLAQQAFLRAEAEKETLQRLAEQQEKELQAALAQSGITGQLSSALKMTEQEIAEAQQSERAACEDVAVKQAAFVRLKGEAKGAKTAAEMQQLAAERDKTVTEKDEFAKSFGGLQESYKKYEQNLAKKCIMVESLRKVEEKRNLASVLLGLVGGKRLMEYVAEEYLAGISDEASQTLLSLTGGRYFLRYAAESGFCIGDNYNGGSLRQTATLSGGETFLVSLSLALALSAALQYRSLRSVEFFFLDEGFGTLDESLVDVVMDSLEKLRGTRLSIGLISHVSELKHRLDSKILVTGATADHGSQIHVV